MATKSSICTLHIVRDLVFHTLCHPEDGVVEVDGEDGMLGHMASGTDKRRFTADEYQRMGETGILGQDERVELIDGETVTVAAGFQGPCRRAISITSVDGTP